MELKVQGENVEKMLELAILQALGDTAKDKLMSEVLAYLVTPQPASGNYYNQGKPNSPIRDMINNAASRVANTIIVKRFEEDPEFQRAINEVVSEAVKKLLIDKERLAEAMSSAMYQALRER